MPTIPDDASWAVTEGAEADWGEARRTQRWLALATVLAQRPTASLPEAWGSRAPRKAASRFFDNDAIDPQDLLASHVEATTARRAAVPLGLAVQDTTELDWTAQPATTGLGPLAHPAQQGLPVHPTMALRPERVPVGLLAQQVWARDPAATGQRAMRQRRPVAAQESQQWLTRVEAVIAAPAQCPQTRFVSSGDREAEVDARFVQERPAGVDRLVRAAWNRRVDHPERALWATVAAHPVVATRTVGVSRRAAQRPTLAVWAVLAREDHPPAAVAPLEWVWLTTWAGHTPAEAIERVTWSACRWGIEVWHTVLKRGGRLEARQLETAERWRRCLAVSSVIAWRSL